ncbi:MAG: ketol-acid reductoisomerase [Planctomycetota bacterium]|nr:ketol-acid reductoisomerase [Planctomycetota bacterium]
MATMDFGGVLEDVVTRDEFPMERAREVLKGEALAVIGYGVQGPAQALNMRDNGLNVIVGQRPGGRSWEKAVRDGWKPGKTLMPVEEAASKGTIVLYLVSDAAQRELWPSVKPHLTAGKALYFSHGFSIVYRDLTGVVPPKDVDVIMVAPKGSGTSVRRNFLAGSGINASFAVFQDATGRARERCLALGVAIGSGFLFPTTFEKETWSDLTGERGVLMGALAGIMEAQYDLLRKNGHTPSEAFNETVEELTQSLIRLVAENGMDWMYANCSTTAQRGALDWKGRFRDAVAPVFEDLYRRVKDGTEAKIVIEANSRPDYADRLRAELGAIRNSEMWRAGATVRALRPENWKAADAGGKTAAGEKTGAGRKKAGKRKAARKTAGGKVHRGGKKR